MVVIQFGGIQPEMGKANRNAGSLELVGGRLCLDFVNTATARGRAGHRDYLCSYDALLAWGRHTGVITAKQSQILATSAAGSPQAAIAALNLSITLREAIYRVLGLAARGSRAAGADLLQVNSAFRQACLHRAIRPRAAGFDWGWEFDPGDLRAILWPVVLSATELLTSPDLARVRQCAREECQWLFFDSSKNGSRRWCSMAACGSRVKSQRFYHRKRRQRQ
jgi:predicted RNA-binding Zn ribbon-like protein